MFLGCFFPNKININNFEHVSTFNKAEPLKVSFKPHTYYLMCMLLISFLFPYFRVEVFICTSPINNYKHCLKEKVRLLMTKLYIMLLSNCLCLTWQGFALMFTCFCAWIFKDTWRVECFFWHSYCMVDKMCRCINCFHLYLLTNEL